MKTEMLAVFRSAAARIGVAWRQQRSDETRPYIIAGAVVILIGVGGFGGWAATAPLASAVIASGSVTVDGNRKRISHLEGGLVSEIVIRDGDEVEAGDLLMRLDRTEAQAQHRILESKWYASKAVESRLRAERDGADMLFFPVALEARREDDAISELLRSQTLLFEARRGTRAGEVRIQRQRISQLEEQLTGFLAQKEAAEEQVEIIGDELRSLEKLLARGLTEKARVLGLKRESARLRGLVGEFIARSAGTREAIGETRMEILQIEKGFHEEVLTELQEVQDTLLDVEERIVAARFVLDRVDIRSPVTGTVTALQVHTVGAVVKPGDVLLEIVPANDRLIIEAQVRPMDIDNVSLGLPADVHLVAYKQRTTPSILGSISYISADRVDDPQGQQSYYVAHIEVEESELTALETVRLYPGMPAEITIRTGSRTFLDYMLQPIHDSVRRAWTEE